MSTSQTSNNLQDDAPQWLLGIPWEALVVQDALYKAANAPATIPKAEELKLRALAEADRKDHYPSYGFDWALYTIGEVIEEEELDTEGNVDDGLDPLTNEDVLVFVLQRKSGAVSESDLDKPGSPDIMAPLATDAQVEELKRRGWVVRWYKRA
ncbi:hypothetical protein GSI_08592 [Ganoderma sinense ZZ0214-1]|uniref:Uncharacterized protein n=1 Tax=Ganoderma sinense ZZ0214-1 TaxID=1077348 RepID=A0A2G8S461_9APHY|nr:hypothetical protein GSI_08592 [Ganoderma sinense ZZ0214-1]